MEKVLKFLSDHNRPFTINDVVQGLNQLGKSQVVSALNKLVDQNLIIEKTCGKQKIYCVLQKSSVPLKELNSNVLEMERQSNSLALKLKDVEKELQKKGARLKELEGTLSKQELLQKKETLEDEIKEMQSKLESFEGQSTESPLDKEKIEREYRAVLKEYNKRKRLCTEMIEAIFENYPKPKKTLLQDIGIETDEDVDFKIKVSIK